MHIVPMVMLMIMLRKFTIVINFIIGVVGDQDLELVEFLVRLLHHCRGSEPIGPFKIGFFEKKFCIIVLNV